MNHAIVLSLLLLILSLQSCGNNSSFEFLNDNEKETIVRNNILFNIVPPPLLPDPIRLSANVDKEFQESKTIDILLSIDNSGSMGPYIDAISSNIESFLVGLFAENIDYQFGVMKNTVNFDGSFDSAPVGNPAVVKGQDPKAIKKIIENIEFVKGYEIGHLEKPINSMHLALGNPLNWSENGKDGLFRENSKFVFINLSDVDEFEIYGDQRHLKDIFDKTNSLSRGRPWQLFSIGSPEKSSCPAESDKQWTMEQLSYLSGGTMGRICGDYSATLLNAMKRVINLSESISIAAKIPFGFTPDEDTFLVSVNGIEAPNDPIIGWTYDPLTKLISFSGIYILNDGDKIEVNFDAIRP